MPASTQTRVIRVKADVSGSKELKEMADYMARLNGNVKNLSGSFGFLRNAFLGYLSLNGLRQLTQVSDSMQNLNSRLVTITGSQENATRTMSSLLRVANETNSSISGVAESYSRLAISLKGAGANQEAIVQLTKVLNNSFRLSGSTVTETTNTIIQLSQAFASGQLRGQELRSVMEQNAVVAGLLRKRFGTDIYKKAAEGAISVTEVLRVLTANMEDINKKALLLTPTFEQTLTKAFNGFKVALLTLNQDFNVSGTFAKTVDFLLGKLPLLGALITALALTQIPALARALTGLAGLAASINPYIAAFTVLATTTLILIDHFDGLDRAGKRVTKILAQIAYWMQTIDAAIYKFLARFAGANNPFTNFGAAAQEFEGNAKNLKAFIEDLGKDISAPKSSGFNSVLLQTSSASEEAKRQLEELTKSLDKYYKGVEGKAPKIKELLAELNAQYLSGAINAQGYSSALISLNLKKLNTEFEQGKLNLDSYNKGIQELNRQELNRSFSEGYISLQQFNEGIASSKLKDLNADLESGKISLIEYRMEAVKLSEEFSVTGSFQAGAAGYISSIGTLGQQTAQAIQNAFTGLETVFSDFIKTGKLNFKEFTQSILDDLTKIIIRASIIKPLANSILGAGGGAGFTNDTANIGGTQAYSSINAKGNAYDRGNVIPFARGGVVGSPTTFGMSGGRTGLMGEAGPEAILPLSRGDGGKLGVQAQVTPVTVNIINNAGAEVQQQETTGPNGERMLDIIIASKVKEQFANGTYDKTLRSQYGLSRKGQ